MPGPLASAGPARHGGLRPQGDGPARLARPRHTPHPVGSTQEEPLDDIAEASAEAVDLRAALAVLPIQQRIVLVLRYWQDLTETEIADLLGCRPGTVKSRLSRGTAQLRNQLGPVNDSATPAADTGQPGQTRPSRWEERP